MSQNQGASTSSGGQVSQNYIFATTILTRLAEEKLKDRNGNINQQKKNELLFQGKTFLDALERDANPNLMRSLTSIFMRFNMNTLTKDELFEKSIGYFASQGRPGFIRDIGGFLPCGYMLDCPLEHEARREVRVARAELGPWEHWGTLPPAPQS